MTKKMDVSVTWRDITPGGTIFEPGNARENGTGEWRTKRPIWYEDKCKQCLLCPPVCPDSSILVNDEGKLDRFDYDHCKGCGACYKVCPFEAIGFVDEE